MTPGTAAPLAALLAALAVATLLPPEPARRLGPRDPARRLRQRDPARRLRPPEPARLAHPAHSGAVPGGAPVPVVTDLVAAALLGGLPPRVAVDAVAAALDGVGDPAGESLRRNDRAFGPLDEALVLAGSTGLGPVPLVQAAATQSRRRRAAAQQVAARRVGTLVVLPTGLCLLPSFVLLTVAPLVVDLLR